MSLFASLWIRLRFFFFLSLCFLLFFIGGQSLAQTTGVTATSGAYMWGSGASTVTIPYTDYIAPGYYKREYHLEWKNQFYDTQKFLTYGNLPLVGAISGGRAYMPYSFLAPYGAIAGHYDTLYHIDIPAGFFDGDSAELYARIKNPYAEGALPFRDVRLTLYGTENDAFVNLVESTAAEDYGVMEVGGTFFGLQNGAFIKSFDTRRGVALVFDEVMVGSTLKKRVRLWLEASPSRFFMSGYYEGEIGDVVGIGIGFKGSASIDRVELKQNGSVVMYELFDVDGQTTMTLVQETGTLLTGTVPVVTTGTINQPDYSVFYLAPWDFQYGDRHFDYVRKNAQADCAKKEGHRFVMLSRTNFACEKIEEEVIIAVDETIEETDEIDPINLAHGAFELYDTWLSLPQGLDFAVSYDNQLTYAGPLGMNRSHNHNIKAFIDKPTGDFMMALGHGSLYAFDQLSFNQRRHDGIGATATIERDGKLVIEYDNGSLVRFRTYQTPQGTTFLVQAVLDQYRQGLTYTYNGDLLTTITHTQGGSIRLLYDNQDRIVGLIDHTGRGVVTQYDADNNLTNVHFDYGTATKNVSYTYTSGFDPVTQDHLNHNLLTITDAEGQVYVTNEYDANDAVIYQNYGGDEGRLSYDRDSNGFVTATTVTARNGSETRYEFGAFENVTSRTTNTAGGSVRHQYDYDADGRITLTRNAEGQETRYIYDTNGNLDRMVVSPRPGFSEPDRVTSFHYDPATSQLAQKTLPDGSVIDYTRNAQGRVTQTDITAQSHNGQTQTRTMTYDYNSKGQLTKLTNQLGEELHFTYHNNLLTSQSLPSLGITKTRVYNNKGYLTSFTDGEGNVWTFTPNDRGQTTRVVSPEGVIQVFDYDLTNNLTLQSVIEGATAITSQYQYNELDLLTQAQLPENRTWDYTWSPHHMIQTITSPKGTEMSFLYDEFDRVISQTVSGSGVSSSGISSQSATVSIDYDIMGRIVSRTDALGYLTRYDYNAWGQLETLTDADGNVWRLVYDDTDLVGLSLTDSLGTALKVQTRQYNGFGQVVSETDHTLTSPNIQLTKSYTYDVLGRMVTSTDPNGNTTYYSYDAANRMVAVTDPLGNTQSFVYDKNNNLTIHTLTDSAGVAHVTSYSYDNDRRLVVMMDNLGQINRYQYNDRGQVVGFSDAKNISQAYVYNDAGELVQVNQHDGEQAVVTHYSYDAHGNLIAMTDANGNISTWQYDYRDRPVTLTYPDGRTMSYQWDDHGNITSWTDTNGTVVHNRYDSLHRLVQRDINHGQGVGGVATEYYEYDGAGRLIFATDDLGQDVTFAYDGGDRLLTESNNNETITYNYDKNSNLTALTYPSAKVFDRSFDAGDRLTGIDWINASTSLTPGSHRQDTVTQRFDSLRKLESLGSNGTQSTYSYDPLLRVARITHSNQGDAPYSDITFEYTYDPVGNIVSDGRDSYTYDDISQLKEINYNVGPHRIGSDGLSAQDGGVVHLNQGGNQRRDTRDYDAMGNRQQHDTTVPRTDRFDTYDSSRGGTNREPVSYQEDVGTELALSSKGTDGNLSSEDEKAQHIVSRETDDITVIDEYLVAQKGNNKGNNQSQGNQGNNAQGNNSNTTNGQSNNAQQGPSQNNLADRCAWKASQNNPGGGRQKKCQGVGNSGSGSQNTGVGTGGNLSNTGNNTQTGNGQGSSDGGRSDDNETFTYSTNNLNQYTSISDEAGNSIGFVYDANGNMIENDTFMFTYDYKNRLIEVRLLGDEYMVVTMSYDVLGRRTTKIINRKSNEGETFMYTYAGAEVLSEHVSYNIGEGRNYTKEYIYGQGIDDVRGFIMTRGDEVRQFWYDKNHLGSVIAITDEEGKIVESYRYDGFGNILIGESKNAIKQTTGPGTKNEQRNVKVDSTGSVGGFSTSWLQNNRLYTSREYDAELNLYYYRGRHYDPRVGRFIQRDPIGYADDTNLYRYVANNPVGYTDPWGLAKKILQENDLEKALEIAAKVAPSIATHEDHMSVMTHLAILCQDRMDHYRCQQNIFGELDELMTLQDMQECGVDFFNGVVKGDFADGGYCVLAGQLAGGEIPLYSIGADARDWVAALDQCEGVGGCIGDVSLASVAFIPGVGWVAKVVKNADKVDDAIDLIDGLRDLTKKISEGHAFTKHIDEFADLGITTVEQLNKHIESIIKNVYGTDNHKILERGREAFRDASTNTIVIIDPNNIDGGTVFIPKNGYDYFLNIN